MVRCPLADKCFTKHQEKVLGEMRLMEKIAKGGGLIKAYYDGKGGWKVTSIKK